MNSFLDSIGLDYFWGKVKSALGGKQDILVSGSSIKTINNQSLLGSGNITINNGDGNVSSTTINTLVSISEADYEALATKDSSTLYIVTA